MNTVIITVAIIILAFVVMTANKEGFETVAEKERVHKEYFDETHDPSYEDYRVKVAGGNVVDYMKYKK
jgi:hypothetical protein